MFVQFLIIILGFILLIYGADILVKGASGIAKRFNISEIIIGLTHKDICTDIHNIKHYGILGISYSPGNVCIISDKRINNKSLIWKTILHEFIHAYYGAKHCPKDDPTCFMVDAKGKGNLAIQNKLCNSCNCYK